MDLPGLQAQCNDLVIIIIIGALMMELENFSFIFLPKKKKIHFDFFK